METECGFLLKKESNYTVTSVDRALELLLILGKNTKDMGVTELSKLLGVQKSTVHSLLQTMLTRGFVQQTENGRYTLGTRLIQLGETCAERLDIRTAARPILAELADETREIALLAILAGNELIIIDKVEPQRAFLIIPKFDFSMAIHSTAVGKVLLSYAPEAVLNQILERGVDRFTQYTLTDKQTLLNELEKVRGQGFAVGCNETIEGITCIAVPIYDVRGNVAAALSISSASSLVSADRYKEIISILKHKAAAISARLGYE